MHTSTLLLRKNRNQPYRLGPTIVFTLARKDSDFAIFILLPFLFVPHLTWHSDRECTSSASFASCAKESSQHFLTSFPRISSEGRLLPWVPAYSYRYDHSRLDFILRQPSSVPYITIKAKSLSTRVIVSLPDFPASLRHHAHRPEDHRLVHGKCCQTV